MKFKPLKIHLGLGILCLAANSQAAPEANAKPEGRGPAAAERRSGPAAPGSSARAPGHDRHERGGKPDADKNSDKSHDGHEGHEGHDGHRGPGGMGSAASDGSAGPGDAHAHHDPHADGGPGDGTGRNEARRGHRRARVHELRAKWGDDTLKRPETRDELKHHAWRMARIERMRALATEKKNDKLIAKLDKLEKKEMERHERAMAQKKGGASAAPTPSAAPAASAQEGAK